MLRLAGELGCAGAASPEKPEVGSVGWSRHATSTSAPSSVPRLEVYRMCRGHAVATADGVLVWCGITKCSGSGWEWRGEEQERRTGEVPMRRRPPWRPHPAVAIVS